MGVTLKLGRDGKPRRHWYGDAWVHGKRRVVNLAVPVQGKIPAPGEKGNAAFTRSRKAAEKALVAFVLHGRQKGRAEHLTERLIEMKTGRAVEHATIADLSARWHAMPREGELTKAYSGGIAAACARFREFMKTRKQEGKPPAVYLYDVTQADAGAFADYLRRGLSARTATGYTALLRSAFRRFLPAGVANPFDGIVTRHTRETSGDDSVHRKPFTAEELTNLIETARDDSFLHPLVVAAACTGMRRGDVCRLKWQDIDLAAGMVTVKASKTGAQVEIPIFAPLRDVLGTAGKRGAKEYVFPAAARMIEDNPDGLTWRFKSLVARAFTKDETDTPPTDPADVLAEGLAAIDRLPEGKRRDHIRDVFTRYMAGDTMCQITAATGASKGSVSGWLSAVSGMIGKPVVRGSTGPTVTAAIATHTRVAREKGHGERAASVRDWHALRSTWVTLALSAGVPMELVRRVTGHATVDIVLRHYFRPGREQFKAVLAGTLPDVLTGGKAAKLSPAEELTALTGKIADGTATPEEKARARKLIELA